MMAKGVVVFISGWASPVSVWEGVILALGSALSYRSFTAEEIFAKGREIWAQLSKEYGDARFIGVGWSIGGELLLNAAINDLCPFQHLFFLGTTPRFTAAQGHSGVPAAVLRKMAARLRESTADVLRSFWSRALEPETQPELVESLTRYGTTLPLEMLQQGLDALDQFDFRKQLQTIDVNSTVVHGQRDLIVPVEGARELAAGIPSANLVVYPEFGHALPLHAPTEIATLIRTALDDTKENVSSRGNFSSAAVTYDLWAAPQRQIAKRLLAFARPYLNWPYLVADVGCGTGYLSDLLLQQNPCAHLLGLDNSPGMQRAFEKRFAGAGNVSFHLSSLEEWRPEKQFDLVISSSALQWINNIDRACQVMRRAVGSHGRIISSTLIRGSLKELEECYALVTGAELAVLELRTAEDYLLALKNAELRVLASRIDTLQFNYDDAFHLLRALQRIGSTAGVGVNHALRVGQMRKLNALYRERFSNAAGQIEATYCTFNFVAEAKC